MRKLIIGVSKREVTVSKRILIVEPDADLRETFRHHFAKRDEWDVTAVSSGQRARREIEADGFHTLLLNPDLPGYAGADILEEIDKQELEGVVVVANTEPSGSDPVEEYEAVTQYLVKPVTLAELEAAIDDALRD